MENEYYYDDNFNEYYDDYVQDPDESHSNVTLTAPSQASPARITTIDRSVLVELLDRDIKKVMDYTCFAYPAAVMLLREFKWSPDEVLSTYFEDQDETLKRMKIDMEAASHVNEFVHNNVEVECEMCLDPIPCGQGVGLSSCEHFFCSVCWYDCVQHRMRENTGLIGMTCPMHGCTELVDHRLLLDLFSKMQVGGNDEASNNIKELMQRGFLKSYVDSSLRYRWCPNPQSCTGIIYMPEGCCTPESAHCEWCGTDLCFRCGGAPHAPATCAEAEKWLAKVRDGGANIAYVLQHTKACPSCKVPIEKNHGCNHMTCRSCSHEFCWICLGDWNKHTGSFYSCNNAAPTPQASEHTKFVNNHRSYVNHLDSSKKESVCLDKARQTSYTILRHQLATYQVSISPDTFTTLLDKMQAVLHSARRYLAFSFVRSYSIDVSKTEGTPSAKIFLFQRGLLEEAAESLSRFLSTFKSSPIDVTAIGKAIDLVQAWLDKLLEN